MDGNGQDPIFLVDQPDKDFRPSSILVTVWKILIFLVSGIICYITLGIVFRYGLLFILENAADLPQQILLTMNWIIILISAILSFFMALYLGKLAIVVPNQYYLHTLLLANHINVYKPGFYVIKPVIEHVRFYLNMQEQAMEVYDTKAYTKDNMPVTVNVVVQLALDAENIRKVIPKIKNLPIIIRKIVEGISRDLVSQYNFDEIKYNPGLRQSASAQLTETLTNEAKQNCIRIISTRFADVIIDDAEVRAAISLATRAKFAKEAEITGAEAESQALSTISEALMAAIRKALPPNSEINLTSQELLQAILRLRGMKTFEAASQQGAFVLPTVNTSNFFGITPDNSNPKPKEGGTQET